MMKNFWEIVFIICQIVLVGGWFAWPILYYMGVFRDIKVIILFFILAFWTCGTMMISDILKRDRY